MLGEHDCPGCFLCTGSWQEDIRRERSEKKRMVAEGWLSPEVVQSIREACEHDPDASLSETILAILAEAKEVVP